MNIITENMKVTQAIAPDADVFAADPASDVFNLGKYRNACFVLSKGAGATGTVTVTVESCDDVVPTTTTAVAFRYTEQTTLDTESDVTAATASGFTTTAGANQIYNIMVQADDLSGTDQFVRVQLVEVADDPCDAGVDVILYNPNYKSEESDMITSIT
jgi:hypothetical protein